jgi:hypothetical protein
MTMGDDKANRPALRRWQRLLTPVLAVSAMVAGTAAVLAPRQQIGWFAYAPSDELVLMDSGARAGYLLVAAALLTLAFWLGYRLGVQRKGNWSGKNR